MYEYLLNIILSLSQAIFLSCQHLITSGRGIHVSSPRVRVSVAFASTHYVYSLVLFTLPCTPETFA